MLRRLVELSLAARLAVLGLALALAGIGGWSFLNLPVDAFPDISSTQVKIILKAPGMTPEEVESRVITPIEMEMLGIPKQQILRSIAKYGIADITIDFQDGTDIYWARSQVTERLSGIMEDIPPSVEGGLAPIATPLTDVYMFTLEGPQSLAEKRRALDWTIRPALRTVPGVADVNSLGGRAETFEVRPDPNLMAAAGLTYEDISTAIGAGNRNDGAGRLSVGDEALIVRAVGAIQTEDDLRAVVVKTQKDGVLRLSDVATVGTGSLTRYGAVTRNGTGEAVGYALNMLEDRGVLFVSPQEKVYEGMLIGENAKPDDLEVNPMKSKQLTNFRSTGKDDAIRLTPPRIMTLEQAIAYIDDDEMVEVTPKSIRLRKALLCPHERKKASRKKEAA